MGKVKWGILGCARIAINALIPAIKKSKSSTLYGIASRDYEKAKRIAEKYQIPRYYGSYEELIDDEEIEAVYIPLPNHLHKEWSIKCAEKGKHILCEKPISLNYKESEEMFTAAEKNNVVLMEAFMYRFHPQIEILKNLIEEGTIGKVKLIRSIFSFIFLEERIKEDYRGKKESGGGAIYDVGCYCINISRYIMGGEPEKIFATANFHPSTGIDLTTCAILEFPEKKEAIITSSFELPGQQFLEVFGTEGKISLPFTFLPEKNNSRIIIEKEDKTEIRNIGYSNLYLLEVEHFCKCIREKEKPLISKEDSINNMKVIDTILKKIRQQEN